MNPLVSFPISSSISLSFPPPVYLSVVYYPSNGLSIISYRKYSPKLLSSPCNCSSFPKQSIKVYILAVTCSQIKSLHPSWLLQAGGHRFKCEKLQLSASQGKCEENIYGLIAKKKNVYSFDDIVVVLWCGKTFFGTVLSKCCSYVDSIYICNHSGYPIRPTEESVQVL